MQANHQSKSEAIAQVIKEKFLDKFPGKRIRLPNIRSLTKELRTSRNTVLTAYQYLEKQGLVERVQGSGVYSVCREQPPQLYDETLIPSKARPEQIADVIAERITSGAYRVGDFLPLQKALQFDFKTSKASMRLAVSMLHKRGLIARHGSGYVIGNARVRKGNSGERRIFSIGEQESMGRALQSFQIRELTLSFERELNAQGGFLLEPLNEKDFASDTFMREQQQKAAGYVYLEIGMPGTPEIRSARVMRLMRLATASRRPALVLDFAGRISQLPSMSPHYRKSNFLMWVDNHGVGNQVARFLAQQGHRSTAFFSFMSENPVCKLRFQGFKAGLRQAFGGREKVLHFPAAFDQKSIKGDTLFMDLKQEHKRLFSQLVSGTFHGYRFTEGEPTELVMREIFEFMVEDSCKRIMRLHFQEALKQNDCTAWVLADYRDAVVAYDFLQEMKIKVPEEISLVSIGDNEKTMIKSITAYDFQLAKIGYLAAHCLIGDIPVRRNRRGLVECPGEIVERRSVRRCA